MKLSPRDAPAFLEKPDARRAGILLFGADAMRVALKRQQVVSGLLGSDDDTEMRLVRIDAGELRKDASLLLDEIKAKGFFPGQRVVLVDMATDSLTKTIGVALQEWQDGDANIVVTAGQLNARSSLRKAFEGHGNAFALGIYDDPPSRKEIQDIAQRAGLHSIDADAMEMINGLARALDPGDFRQTIEKLSLFKFGDDTPVTAADVAACSPATFEAAIDEALACVAEAREADLALILQRLAGQGVQAVGLCIGATRHFRALHAAASDPKGPGAGMARLRPPVYGPRRDRMERQARAWGVAKLERALQILTETDLTLRSSSQSPKMAVVERALIRLSMLAKT